MLIKLLNAAGVIVFVIGLAVGLISLNLLAFLVAVVGSLSSAIIFFALARILGNQEYIMRAQGQLLHDSHRASAPQVICAKCGGSHDKSQRSCPLCGFRAAP